MARIRRTRPPQSSTARALRITVRVALPVVFALGLWYVFTNVVRFGYVFSASMEPTCAEGDWYILRLDAYRDHGPERGDIIVFADAEGELCLKRVIAVGGDEIAIINGTVWLNGRALDEPYLKERTQPERPIMGKVGDGQLCVLGDNRNFSADSRDTGFVAAEEVMGRVTRIVWPRERAHSLVARR
jgi:signal peptidase I